MKRQRGRGRKGGGGQHNNNRALESNGPDVKVRGAASTIYEKYQQLARDAASSGDRVRSENYLQHAEHYFRIMRAQEESRQSRDDQRQNQNNNQNNNQGGQNAQNNQGGQNQPRGQDNSSDNDDDKSDGRSDARAKSNGKDSGDNGGPLEMVTPEEGDLTESATEKKPRRSRKPKAKAEDKEPEEATEDAA